MPKKKTETPETPETPEKPGRTADRHKSGFMIRLPESHRAALELLKKKHRRNYTEEVQIALEKHYKAEGIEFLPD